MNAVIQSSPTSLIDNPEAETAWLSDIAERVLGRARAGGAAQVEVSLSSSLSREAGVRLGEIETLEEARDRGVRVTVYCNQCSGTASTGDLRLETVDECVDRALAIARHTQPDKAAGLADAELMARELVDLDLWHPVDIPMADLIARALEIEQAGRDADPRIANSEGASVNTELAVGVYANSHGFMGAGRASRYSQSCVLIARDEKGMQRDYDWDSRRQFGELADPLITGQEAARRTVRRLGGRRAPTGAVPVMFAPEVARGLIGHLVSAVSGGALYRRSSYLLDSLGQQVLPSGLSLIEQPRQPGGPASANYDADGVATRESALVADGELLRYVLSAYSARRLGLQTTANAGGVRNLRLEGPARPPAELMAQMQNGLLVTEVMGQGVNLVTGDYSRGAAGFWIENGQIAWPVEEITIAGHLRDMLSGLIGIGDDYDDRHRINCGSLLVDRMMVAGQQD